MADRTVYIVGMNKKYLTNKTNITRLWEIVERELGEQVKPNLTISYKENETDIDYTETPARSHKIKQLCIDAVRNRILIHPVDVDPVIDSEECISIQQDILGGKD